MTDGTATFHGLRPRLQAIAYRMLGSVADAEDVVQEAWLRWHDAEQATIATPEAWLVTVTTRLAIDRLRALKVQREHYPGIWLPEPLPEALHQEPPATPEHLYAYAQDVSIAFLTLLERLAPEARAAFLLREVFDASYDEVAHVLGKSEAACRQIVHRARTQVRDGQPRYAVSPETHQRLLHHFADAIVRGDFAQIHALLADDAELIGDGGGLVSSFPKPLRGGRRIAQLFFASYLRFRDRLRLEHTFINGEWTLLRFIDGNLESVQSLEIDGDRVLRVLVQRNPDKLAGLVAALEAGSACHKPAAGPV